MKDMAMELHPTLWRTCRVLSGETRLKLLRLIIATPGKTVSRLAEETGIGLSRASQELRRLQSRGLVQTVRKGSFVHYLPDPDPQVPDAKPLLLAMKATFALAPRYSELVTDARLRKKVFTSIEAEWHRTADALTRITGEKQRLAHNAALARSIKHRFPYIDPLHHLQVELVRRWRAGQGDERVQTGIHISINGIAAGLRNTG